MGGKSGGGGSQVVGYKYYANLVASLGNPIEDVLAVNFDKRGPQYGTVREPIEYQGKQYGVRIRIAQGSLYGKDEGGVMGNIFFYFGENHQLPDLIYAAHMQSNGKYPVAYQGFMSYAVFSGTTPQITLPPGKKGVSWNQEWREETLKKALNRNNFYFGNSNTIRDMRYLVTRVFKQQDNREQWYASKAGILAGTIEDIKIEVKRLALILDNSGSMAGTRINALKAALNNLKTNIQNDVVKFNELQITVFGNLAIHYHATSKAQAISNITTAISVLDASGSATDAMQAFSAFPTFFTNASNRDLAIVVSDGEMSNINEAKSQLIKDSVVRIAGIGVESIGSLAEFHNMQNEIPVVSGNASEITDAISYAISLLKFNYYDINPIHAIRELLTDFRAMGIPESEINDENFRCAADRNYSEGLGVSFQLADKNIKEAIDEICAHIEGGVRVNRQTGLYEIVLFRDDWFDLDTVPHFTVSSMNNIEIQPVGGGVDDVNTLNIKYNDRELDQDISFPIYNAGARHNAGRENPSDVDLTYFKNKRNADLVGQWKLKIATLPAWQGEFRTSVYDARKINRYDVIKISPGVHGIEALPVRVMEIGLGDGASSNEVTLKFQEVTFFSNDDYAITPIEPPIVTDTSPTQADFIVHEVTYWEAVKRFGQRTIDARLAEDPYSGYLGVSAVRPKASVMSAALHTDAGGGYVEHSTIFFCPCITLDQDIGYTDSLFNVRNPQAFDEAIPGSIIRINDELMLFMDYDEETSLMRVKRGVSPTVPKPHLKDAVFYFVDNATHTDGVEYLTGEIVNAKVQSITASTAQDLDTAQVKSLEIVGLANRPYPPANVQINGEYWPEEIEGNLELTWAHRNRIQQTGGVQLGWMDSSVASETGVTYVAELYNARTNALYDSKTNITSDIAIFEYQDVPELVKLNLYAVRGDYASYQKFQHVFAWGEPPEIFITAFTSSGTFTVPESVTSVDVLVVAGGGGGGSRQGGGGGAGGLIVQTVSVIPLDVINVTVGLGGAGGVDGGQGADGQNSSFGSIIATGGGGGGGRTVETSGRVGGSGGGGSGVQYVPGVSEGGASILAQGSAGGQGGGFNIGTGGGGGGGAGGVGGTYTEVAGEHYGGDGGVGVHFQALENHGSGGWFAGGGGGAKNGGGNDYSAGGLGGVGGGGRSGYPFDAATSAALPQSGQANTGGGGGGSFLGTESGGNGGSGIVIIATAGTFL